MRLRPPAEKVRNRLRMQRPKNKEAGQQRDATAEAKRKKRERQNNDEHRAQVREAKREKQAARKKADRARVEKIYCNTMADDASTMTEQVSCMGCTEQEVLTTICWGCGQSFCAACYPNHDPCAQGHDQ